MCKQVFNTTEQPIFIFTLPPPLIVWHMKFVLVLH